MKNWSKARAGSRANVMVRKHQKIMATLSDLPHRKKIEVIEGVYEWLERRPSERSDGVCDGSQRDAGGDVSSEPPSTGISP